MFCGQSLSFRFFISQIGIKTSTFYLHGYLSDRRRFYKPSLMLIIFAFLILPRLFSLSLLLISSFHYFILFLSFFLSFSETTSNPQFSCRVVDISKVMIKSKIFRDQPRGKFGNFYKILQFSSWAVRIQMGPVISFRQHIMLHSYTCYVHTHYKYCSYGE
jgi:hypothetical protein